MRDKNINKKYKDRLFRLVFREKKDLLELYNAVNRSDYRNADALKITTLEDAIYMGMKNDISFLIDDILNLYEHQSTYNPNMPVRGFLYMADLYRKYINGRKLNLYGSSLMKLPFPKYLVFYNGLRTEPDWKELNLSDAFLGLEGEEPCLEFKATMININLGHNKELMERCRRLKEYAQFVAAVRAYLTEGFSLEEAVDAAVEQCIREGVLADFLSTHRAEVHEMVLTEYDEQSHIAIERAEAKAEGRMEGRMEDILTFLEDIGDVPEDIRGQVMSQKDPEILKQWLKAASKADTMEAFREQLRLSER